MKRGYGKSGFTLVELLVVITIIGILIALLLPAVQAAREAARRMQCTNNLKQLGLAFHNYHNTNQTLPAGAYCTTTLYGCHTWIESLLPYIEQQGVYDQIKFTTTINGASTTNTNAALFKNLLLPGLGCPTDRYAGLFDRAQLYTGSSLAIVNPQMGESYAPNGGPMAMTGQGDCDEITPIWSDRRNCYLDDGGRGSLGSHGLFSAIGKTFGFNDCTDGLSNTFLAGEQLPGYTKHSLYFNSHCTLATTNIPPNIHNAHPECPEFRTTAAIPTEPCSYGMMGYKSSHSGGLNMAMADGSVHFVNETIDYNSWVYMGSRADGEPVQVSD